MTTKRNITVAIEAGLLKKARAIAAQRGSSVSGLLADHLRTIVDEDATYALAKKRAMELMAKGWPLGGKPLSREEIYDRKGLR